MQLKQGDVIIALKVDAIKHAVSVHLPGRIVQCIKDRGIWERHIIEVTLDKDEVIFLKIQLTDWNMTGFETKAVQLFQEHGLPTPALDRESDITPGITGVKEARP